VEESVATYIIAFDSDQISNYQSLQQGIDIISFNAWIKPTKSQFIIRSTLRSEQIRDSLQNYLLPSDQVFIAKIDLTNWAAKNLDSDLMNALKTQFY
jgi:hypothetical protein